MRPGDLLRAIHADIILCQPSQELQKVSPVGGCRVNAQIPPAQTFEVPGE